MVENYFEISGSVVVADQLSQDLHAKLTSEAEACLALGLPTTISHIIDEASPLYSLSIQEMASRRMEVQHHVRLWHAL
jgi:hypothetical protein